MDRLLESYLKFPIEEPIDERRYERHATFVPTSLLTERLSPQGYRPEILAARQDLATRHKCHALQTLCKKKIRQGSTPEFGVDGPICLKPKQVRPLLIDHKVESHVSARFASENRSRMIPSDVVLINRSGAVTLGRTGIYLDNKEAFISEHIFSCQVKPPNDAAFLAVYLNSWWGKRSLESGIAGSTGQLQLPQTHVAALPIPEVNPNVQLAIGNMVRKAHRLRIIAEAAGKACQQEISNALSFVLPNPTNEKTHWLPPSDVDSRLDAKFNSPTATAARRLVRSHPRSMLIEDISVSIHCGPFGSTLVASEHEEKGEVTLISPTDLAGRVFAAKPGWHIGIETLRSKGLSEYKEGAILFSRVGYPYCKVLPKRIEPATIGSRIIAIEPRRDIVDPFYVQAFFESPIGEALLESVQKEVAQPTTATRELALLPIPVVDLDLQNQIGAYVKTVDNNTHESIRMIEAAKTSIEQLLIGTLNESTILETGQELEKWLGANPIPDFNGSN